jgi:hypothetical protein
MHASIRRTARLLAAASLATLAALAQAKLTGNGGPPAGVNDMAGFVPFENPLQADTVDSDLLGNVQVPNKQFWRYVVEEKALDGDGVFNDLVITGNHKGLLVNGNFDNTMPGPQLSVTFKDVVVGQAYAAKNDMGLHGGDDDTLNVQILVIPGNNFGEVLVNLTHLAAVPPPVPEPAAWALWLAGMAGLALRRLRQLLLAGATLAAVAPGAGAGSLAYDGFDYLPGSLPLNNGGSGFAAPWIGDPGVTVGPPGLSQPLGRQSQGLRIGGGFVASRQLAATLAEPEYWASFMIEADPGNDQVWLGLDTAPSSLPAIAFGRRLDKYFIQAGGGAPTFGGIASPPGVTDLLVARIRQTAFITTVDVWVDVNDFTLPPLLSLLVPTLAYDWVNVEVQPGLFADEVRLGTDPASVAAVPEPAPGSMFAAGVAWLALRRKALSSRPSAVPRRSPRPRSTTSG